MKNEPTESRPVILVAWIFLLLASGLIRIVLQEMFYLPVSADLAAGIAAGVFVVGLLITSFWPAVHSLRPFFLLGMILVATEWFVFTRIDQLPFYRAWLSNSAFNVYMLAEQSLRLLVTLVLIAALFWFKGRASAFFLVPGDVRAGVEPVRWLGIGDGQQWHKLGRTFAVILSSGTLAFLILAGRPPVDLIVRAVPFLPAILIAAALNAFNEEMTYKASFLSVLEGVVGRHQALWLMAAYFGIGHFYGVPYGLIGVAMAGFLGWFLGKSMLETRGLGWAWFIHFWQDVLIFSFLAIGSIRPGG